VVDLQATINRFVAETNVLTMNGLKFVGSNSFATLGDL
jgi:hypothetical protein